jgi:hypothetical protein
MENKYLTEKQLSDRWGGSPTPGTLRNWRHQGKGPRYVKIGQKPKYLLSDVLKYERKLKRR